MAIGKRRAFPVTSAEVEAVATGSFMRSIGIAAPGRRDDRDRGRDRSISNHACGRAEPAPRRIVT
ncbi:MAG: hypothetical protein ACPMAQ_18945, partial [Phycisphaerae bacterium]